MGSQGWARCGGCHAWAYDMYIRDGVGPEGYASLCPACLSKLCNRFVAERYFRQMFGEHAVFKEKAVAAIIAELLAAHWEFDDLRGERA